MIILISGRHSGLQHAIVRRDAALLDPEQPSGGLGPCAGSASLAIPLAPLLQTNSLRQLPLAAHLLCVSVHHWFWREQSHHQPISSPIRWRLHLLPPLVLLPQTASSFCQFARSAAGTISSIHFVVGNRAFSVCSICAAFVLLYRILNALVDLCKFLCSNI